MSSEAHGSIGYSAAELRDAMTFYGIPGRADIEGIPELDDLRGDGIDIGAEAHGGNLGNVNAHALQRGMGLATAVLEQMQRYNCLCISWGKGWIRIFRCNYTPSSPSNPTLSGDEFFLPTGDGIDGDSGCGAVVVGVDDEPSVFALDYFDSNETEAGEWAESMLAVDVLGEDDLYALGWDPFKSIKKAVRPLAKTAKAAVKKASKVASGVTRMVGKVPIVGKVAASGLRTVGAVGKAATKLNPISILTNPKAVLAAQVAAAKSAVGTAKQSLSVAKQLAKSPVVKTVVGGAAIVFPPIGVPAAAALATAAAVAGAIDSKVPQARAAAQKVVENTAKLAQAGDKGAEIALAQIATQKKALLADKLKNAPAGTQRLVFDVNRQGRINRVAL